MVLPQNRDLDELSLLMQGFQVARLIKAAADLELANKIEPEGSTAVKDLAASCQVESSRLLRVLRALAAFGIFTVDDLSFVGHSKKSLLLRTDNNKSLHYMARLWAMPSNWSTWGAFDLGLCSGPTASEVVLGTLVDRTFSPVSAFDYNTHRAYRFD